MLVIVSYKDSELLIQASKIHIVYTFLCGIETFLSRLHFLTLDSGYEQGLFLRLRCQGHSAAPRCRVKRPNMDIV